jgi:hypothetical protein
MKVLLNNALRFIATTSPLHPICLAEPAIAAQDRYRRRLSGTSSRLAPQSRNGMRLQLIHRAKGLSSQSPMALQPPLHCSLMQGLLI